MQMMLHQRTGTAMQVAGGIYRAEGVLGFWRGNGGCSQVGLTSGTDGIPARLVFQLSKKGVHGDTAQISVPILMLLAQGKQRGPCLHRK